MPIYEYAGKRPLLAEGVFVADSATVLGDVTIGEASSVWFSAVVRGDVHSIRIGARTNVQDGSVVHVTGDLASTTIGDDVTIGHMVLLHGCTVGDRVLVGMGSIVLDGATIGAGSFLAAGSLVTPRTQIPPGSFVLGRPAKVVRPVTESERIHIESSAEHYVEHARTYRAGGLSRIDVVRG